MQNKHQGERKLLLFPTIFPIRHYALRASDPITTDIFKTDIVKVLHFCWEQTYSQGYSGDPW